ncbi:integrase [Stenotrophomonas maltophilia]|nr:integrase [Stenotrophomonas maltophilia]
MARPRKHNPTIPGHIDQKAIPKGIYWDKSGSGRWYVLDFPRKAVTVADSKAQLSDLHAIIEARSGAAEKGTVGYVMDHYHKSTKFASLSDGTKKGYRHQKSLVESYMTKRGVTLDKMLVSRLSVAAIQRVVESIASGHNGERPMPTKANHLHRYLSLVLAWGVQHGYCQTNPAQGVAQAKERKQFKMPTPETYAKLVAFARDRGSRKAHTEGSVAPYLAPLMVITYLCRLRGIEAVTLTDANSSELGMVSNRRKGSKDNVTEWNDALREAWNALVQLRTEAMERHGIPFHVRADKRPLVVSQKGLRLTKSGLDSAWQRLMDLATSGEEPLLKPGEEFTLHGLKHRGITDSEKPEDGGHKSAAMRDRYDHRLPVVKPASLPDFSGSFSGRKEKGATTDA